MRIEESKRLFTVGEYDRMLATGILHEGESVELIGGEVVRMTSMGARHAAVVFRAGRDLTLGLRDATVRIQLPVRLDDWNEPEPDIAVVRPRGDDYMRSHPGPADILLLIEVADRSLAFDQTVKLPLYAASGIPEVWIVNLEQTVVTMCRDPGRTGYGSCRELDPHKRLTPLAFPRFSIGVGGLLA